MKGKLLQFKKLNPIEKQKEYAMRLIKKGGKDFHTGRKLYKKLTEVIDE